MIEHTPRPPRQFARRARLLLLVLFSLSFSGCYSIEEAGDTATIRFSPVWQAVFVLVPFGIVVGLLTAAWFVRWFRVQALIAIVALVALSVLIVPGMIMDHVEITPTEISQTTGFWFAQYKKGFRYAEVKSVTIRDAQEGRKVRRVWDVHRKDGTTQEIDPGDLWDYNEEFVVEKLRGYGVIFQFADEPRKRS